MGGSCESTARRSAAPSLHAQPPELTSAVRRMRGAATRFGARAVFALAAGSGFVVGAALADRAGLVVRAALAVRARVRAAGAFLADRPAFAAARVFVFFVAIATSFAARPSRGLPQLPEVAHADGEPFAIEPVEQRYTVLSRRGNEVAEARWSDLALLAQVGCEARADFLERRAREVEIGGDLHELPAQHQHAGDLDQTAGVRAELRLELLHARWRECGRGDAREHARGERFVGRAERSRVIARVD